MVMYVFVLLSMFICLFGYVCRGTGLSHPLAEGVRNHARGAESGVVRKRYSIRHHLPEVIFKIATVLDLSQKSLSTIPLGGGGGGGGGGGRGGV